MPQLRTQVTPDASCSSMAGTYKASAESSSLWSHRKRLGSTFLLFLSRRVRRPEISAAFRRSDRVHDQSRRIEHGRRVAAAVHGGNDRAPEGGKEVGTLSNQICARSSGSGSRTGTSGFSGGLGGSLMGAGEGSEGVRRWWRVGEGVSICVSTNMAF